MPSKRHRALPHAAISCTYFDLYRANLAANHWQNLPPNLRIECAVDLPDEEADAVALPFSAGGEAELTRELIQAGHQRLRVGGKLFAATNNPDDKWLREQLAKIFAKLDRCAVAAGTRYIGTKAEPLKKTKNFSCEFPFRDRGRLIRAFQPAGSFFASPRGSRRTAPHQ